MMIIVFSSKCLKSMNDIFLKHRKTIIKNSYSFSPLLLSHTILFRCQIHVCIWTSHTVSGWRCTYGNPKFICCLLHKKSEDLRIEFPSLLVSWFTSVNLNILRWMWPRLLFCNIWRPKPENLTNLPFCMTARQKDLRISSLWMGVRCEITQQVNKRIQCWKLWQLTDGSSVVITAESASFSMKRKFQTFERGYTNSADRNVTNRPVYTKSLVWSLCRNYLYL